MGHVTLAIRHLQDEQMLLRRGGLYWIALDRTTDAEIFARQFLSALSEDNTATLICSGTDPEAIAETLAADCGPSALRMFSMPHDTSARQAFTALTSDLQRIKIARGSQLVLMLNSAHLESLGTQQLQRWCESVEYRLHSLSSVQRSSATIT